jgi:hypothetical protein
MFVSTSWYIACDMFGSVVLWDSALKQGFPKNHILMAAFGCAKRERWFLRIVQFPYKSFQSGNQLCWSLC